MRGAAQASEHIARGGPDIGDGADEGVVHARNMRVVRVVWD
jgi:hypothetical protein